MSEQRSFLILRRRIRLLLWAIPIVFALAFWVGSRFSGSDSGTGDDGTPTPPPSTAVVPYQLSLESVDIEGLPGLHSMAHAVHDGQLVLMSGRINGMHGFPDMRTAQSNPSFPKDKQNDTIFVLDLASFQLVAKASVRKLSSDIARQLTSTNTQYATKDGFLYLVGGYGDSENGRSLVTLDQVMAIDLEKLIADVKAAYAENPEAPELIQDRAKKYMFTANHPALAITGGDLVWADPYFLLIFGHLYNGLYTAGGGGAQQEYSSSVRAFHFNLGSQSVSATYVGQVPFIDPLRPSLGSEGPYHRRDLTVLPVLDPSGGPRIGAFGGAFKGGRFEGFVNPVYIWYDHSRSLINMNEDISATQWLSQYMTATVPLYSKSQRAMYTTFFGGISQYYWDSASGSLKRDAIDFNVSPPVDGLPFIDSISTLRVNDSGTGQFLHKDEVFPPADAQPKCGTTPVGFLGAETVFVANKDLPMSHEVILLDEIEQPITVGYLVGGIAASKPYPGKETCASSKIYRVTLSPGASTDTIELSGPSK